MNEHSSEYLTPQDEKIEIRKTVIESLASENYSKSEIDRFVKNAVDPLLENNDLETDEDTETFSSNLNRIIGNFEKEQTNNKSTPEVKETSDDIETVVGKIRSDLTNKGYKDTEVNRFINKALHPLIKKSDFSDTNESARMIHRIISNFSKEQDKKLAQQVNKGTSEKDVKINKKVETTEENPTNLISEFPGLIKNYREQLGYGDNVIDKQRGTPRYRALQTVNQMQLDSGKLVTALSENTDEETLQKIQTRMVKQKQLVEDVLHMPREQWDIIDNLEGTDVYKNMQEQLATAKYNISNLLKTHPEVRETSEYSVYKQFVEKIKPLMEDEKTMYQSHITVRNKLDSISMQVKFMQEKYTSDEKNDQSGVESDSIGTYTDPDEAYLNNQQQWKKGVPYSKGEPSTLQEEIDKMGADPSLDTFVFRTPKEQRQRVNKEISESDPEGLFAWGEQKRRLLGMKIPKAGPEGVFSSRSFREGLLLMVNTGRVEGYQTDPAIKEKIDRILKIVNYVPDTGLTNEEVSQLESLIYDVALHENPIHKKIEENASLRAKEVVEKLPALAEIPKKKRGFFSRIARSFMLTLPLVVPGSSLDNNDGLNTIHAMTKTPVTISDNGLTPVSAPKTFYADDAVRPNGMKIPTLHAVENSTPDTTSGIDTFTPVTENFEIVPSKNNPKSYATYNDSEDVSPIGPEYAEQETSVEKQVIEYTFLKGSKVDTVSEAALEMWKINSSVIDKSVTQSSFLSAMWGVISDLEKDSNLAKQVTEDMSMDSTDIHHVHSGETIELQAFYELINKKLS